MASAQTAKKRPATTSADDRSDRIEEHVIAFAEQVGFLIGTVQAKAEGWLESDRLSKAVGQIRDSAAQLLEQLNVRGQSQPKASVSPAAGSGAPRARGPVDAPGKRHRKPPPQEPIDKRMGTPQGKRMGQKSLKTGGFRRRG